jgi:mannose-1-phosphate guanylyltransferase
MMIPVILAGGCGSRLWPKSRVAHPKQFLSLTATQSMLQDTLARIPEVSNQEPIIICNEAHRFLVAEQLRQVGVTHNGIILEPVARNTAPAITLAALNAVATDPEATLLILAADHVIQDHQAFAEAIKNSEILAAQDKLVTFGIVPQEPHTGYGYIQIDISLQQDQKTLGFEVLSFTEKPDLRTAQDYVDSGQYFWNSGMFVFKAKTYLAALKKFAPDILRYCTAAVAQQSLDLDFIRIPEDTFLLCPDVSIDTAIMEHTDDAVMVPLDAGWSDVGSWTSLWDLAEKDANGNAVTGDVMLHNAKSNYVNSEGRLVTLVGCEGLVVVETKDAVMVAKQNAVQDIKHIVNQLKASGRPEYEFHRKVFRPWGSYDLIDQGQRFQVKRISVKPKEKLSLQMHHHRAEHWIVVSGTAKVTIGERTVTIVENESTYIPIGEIHALENPGETPLELIEVQSGSYLGEDDIIRFSDRYGRSK